MKINGQEFQSIKSIEVFNDGSGQRLRLTFQNGSCLDVCPENDGVHFYRDPKQENPDIGFMTHITGEFQPAEDKRIEVGVLDQSQVELFAWSNAKL